jgi:hypothetical protein
MCDCQHDPMTEVNVHTWVAPVVCGEVVLSTAMDGIKQTSVVKEQVMTMDRARASSSAAANRKEKTWRGEHSIST